MGRKLLLRYIIISLSWAISSCNGPIEGYIGLFNSAVFSQNSITVSEGSTTSVNVVIAHAETEDRSFSVQILPVTGNASAAVDFPTFTATLTITAGQLSAQVLLQPILVAGYSGDKIFTLSLTSSNLTMLLAQPNSVTVNVEDLDSPLNLNPGPTVDIMTGESTTFAASGGTPAYTYADQGSGYLNLISNIYSAPLYINPFTEFVSVTDALFNMVTSTVKIRAMQKTESMKVMTTGQGQTYDATIASNGDVYQVGRSWSPAFWLVKKSTDTGANWIVSDSYYYNSSYKSQANAVLALNANTLFVTGSARYNSFDSYWVVRKSTDAGQTWATVDLYLSIANGDCGAMSITADVSNNIYVTGTCADLGLVTRKSSDGGSTWAVIDTVVNQSGRNIFYDSSNGYLYVGGYGNSRGVIRRSTDNGVTWAQIDNYLGGQGATLVSKVAAKGNNIYWIGKDGSSFFYGGGNPTSNIRWLTRVSNDGGATWTTRDYFQRAASYPSYGTGISIDSSNNIYAFGCYNDSAYNNHVLTRKSSDNGVTWSDVDYYLSGVGYSISGGYVASDNSVISFGYYSGSSDYKNFVRRSTDNGSTWSIIDNAGPPMPAAGSTYNVLQTSSGKLLAVGTQNSGTLGVNPINGPWYVRISSDVGTTWVQSDSYQYQSGGSASAAIETQPGTYYVTGTTVDASSAYHWVLRKSVDSGTTWATIDDYSCPSGTYVQANDITEDENGNLYMAGACYDSINAYYNWIIRKSVDAGNSWTVVDTFNLVANKSAHAVKIKSDKNGRLFAIGKGMDASSKNHWLVRLSTDSGVTWVTVDDYVPSAGTQSAYATDIAINNLGHAVVVGSASEASTFWLARISSDNGSTWSNVDTFMPDPGYVSPSAQSIAIVDSAYYVSGYEYDAVSFRQRTIIRKSKDLTNWYTVESSTNYTINALTACGTDGKRLCAVGREPSDFNVNIWTTRVLSP